MSKRLQIIAVVIVVVLAGVFYYIVGTDDPPVDFSPNRNQSSEYVRVVLIDDHPRLDFDAETQSLEEMVRALSLTKHVFTLLWRGLRPARNLTLAAARRPATPPILSCSIFAC